MLTFTIGEVEVITGVKAHTLRYWDEAAPTLAASRSVGDQRSYTVRDIAAISRVRHLMEEKKLSVSKARTRLLAEEAALRQRGEEFLGAMQTLEELRGELLLLWARSRLRSTPRKKRL